LALLARCSASTAELAPLEWQKVPGTGPGGAVLGFGAPGTFDERGNFTISAFKEGGVFKLYYGGADATGTCAGPNGSHWRVGLAESTDGINFTRMNDGPGPDGTVLPLGPPGSIDEKQIGYVWVVKDVNEYKMYYSANDAHLFWRVGLAVSTDARHWTKVPGKLQGGAILDLGPPGSFDVACAYEPSVVKESDQLYRMWYRGCQAPGVHGGPSLGVFGY